MTMTEYLRASRESNAAWLADFRLRYNTASITHDDEFSAAESYEAHQHHAEYAPASH